MNLLSVCKQFVGLEGKFLYSFGGQLYKIHEVSNPLWNEVFCKLHSQYLRSLCQHFRFVSHREMGCVNFIWVFISNRSFQVHNRSICWKLSKDKFALFTQSFVLPRKSSAIHLSVLESNRLVFWLHLITILIYVSNFRFNFNFVMLESDFNHSHKNGNI